MDWFTRRRGETSTARMEISIEISVATDQEFSHTLATDGTLGTDTGGVLTGTAVDNGVNSDLERVLVGHDVDL